MSTEPTNDERVQRLLEEALAGNEQSWAALVEGHRDRLRRMVAMRMDPRLQSRIDASDVLQETFVEAWTRLKDYHDKPAMPFFLWLRFLTGQKLVTLYRHHLGTHMRDAGREVSMFREALPEASSMAMAIHLLGNEPRPSEVAVHDERKQALQQALQQMDPTDREVLALRHFEQLNRAETARVLGLQESATSKRYVRALAKLKGILTRTPGLQDLFEEMFG